MSALLSATRMIGTRKLLAVLAAGTFAGCGADTDRPDVVVPREGDEMRGGFVDACLDEGNSGDYCDCAFNMYVQGRVDAQEAHDACS